MKKDPRFRQQGDVLFHEMEDAVAGEFKDDERVTPDAQGRYVLVMGEATGHAHAIEATPDIELYQKNGQLYVRVKGEKPATVTHEEHGPVQLMPKKTYRVGRVREVDPFTEREHNVYD